MDMLALKMYYNSIEEIVDILGIPENIEVGRIQNTNNPNFYDFYYKFNFNGYFILFVNIAPGYFSSNLYCLNIISISPVADNIFKLLPYKTREQYKTDVDFGYIVHCDDKGIMYEVGQFNEMLVLFFENGIIERFDVVVSNY
jgi:hypothetical protein